MTRTSRLPVPWNGNDTCLPKLGHGILLCSLIVLGLSVASQALPVGTLFSPAVGASSSSFTFTAAGDHGWSSDTDSSLSKLKEVNPAFHISLGDLGYTSDAAGWCSYFKDQFNNIEFITGNHDTDESGPGNLDGPDGYVTNCPFTLGSQGVTLNGQYGREYYFDYPASSPLARFIMVSTGVCSSEICYSYSAGSEHYSFVASAIDTARASSIPWIVVGSHKGCIYAGDKGSCDWDTDLWDLMFSKKVDLVLQAHAHIYERSKQLSCAPPGTFDSSCVMKDGSSFTKGSGPVVIIDGTFGEGNRSVDANDEEAPYFESLMDSDYGFTKYTVTSERIDAQFVSSSGGFSDSFAIAGSGSGANPPATQPPLFPALFTDLWLVLMGVILGAVAGIAIFGARSRHNSKTRVAALGEAGALPASQVLFRRGTRRAKPRPTRSSSKGKLTVVLFYTALLIGGALSVAASLSTTNVNAATTVVFSASGDYGTGAASWPVIAQHGGDFHLVLGDLSYSGGEASWCADFKSYFNNVVLVSGNHDDGSDGDIYSFRDACGFPLATPLVGDYAIVHYFDFPATTPLVRVVESTPGVFDDGSAFVQNAIRDARSRGIPWVVYGSHKVCIEPTGDKSCEIGQGFFDMLLSEGVDLILQAHAHTYSRSHQLVCGDDGSFIPSCVVDSNSQFVKGAGTVLVIQGIGGRSIRSSGWGDPDSDYFAVTKGGDGCSTDGSVSGCPSADFGMVQYTVTENSLQAQVFYDSGETFDPWSIGQTAPSSLSSSFTRTPTSLLAGDTVSFSGRATGGTAPYAFSWNFGDGATASGPTVSHAYLSEGTYNAVLTVNDSVGGTASASSSIVVSAQPPPGVLTPEFKYSPQNPTVGQLVAFTGTASGGTAPYSFAWDLGDSSSDTGSTIQHSYSTSGSFTVTLTVTDHAATEATTTMVVDVASQLSGISTSFSFRDPNGNDISSAITWQVWDGSNLVSTASHASLNALKSYELRTFYQGHLIVTEGFTAQPIIQSTIFMYSHNSAPNGYIVFNATISSLVVDEESNSRLRFTAEGVEGPYTVIIRVPEAPSAVLKEGSDYRYTYYSGDGVVVLETSSLSNWEFNFVSGSHPPGLCPICPQIPQIPISLPSSLWLVAVGSMIGLTASLSILTHRAHSRLQRVRKLYAYQRR